ncbi:hypothetical protein ACTXT7_006796 [Hymenolepis weldensis]
MYRIEFRMMVLDGLWIYLSIYFCNGLSSPLFGFCAKLLYYRVFQVALTSEITATLKCKNYALQQGKAF